MKTHLKNCAITVLLLAIAISTPAAAQNIYVGTDAPGGGGTVIKYAPDGSVITPSLITGTEETWVGLSVTGTTLVLTDQSEFSYNDGIGQIGTTFGEDVGGIVFLPHGFPTSAFLGGPHVFALYSGVVGEFLASDGSEVDHDVSSGLAASGKQMAGWTDATGTVHMYVTIPPSGSNPGSVLYIKVDATGSYQTPNLITGLNSPDGIAVSPDGHYIYVVNSGAIVKYPAGGGAPLWTSATVSGTPWSIAASSGAVFVTRQTANAVGAYYGATGAGISDTFISSATNPLGIAVGPPACARPPANMVAWYSLDQNGSSQNDLTSYRNTATAHNTSSVLGEVAGAQQFDGSSSYVDAPERSQLDLGMGDFSIDAWVRIDHAADDSGVVVIVDKRDTLHGYHMFLYNGRIGVQLADGASFSNYVSTPAVPPDGQWHLVAVTVHRGLPAGGTWYLDGAPVGTFDPRAHSGSLNNSKPLYIGVRSPYQNGGGYFKGGIDEVEIFSRALDAGEIFSIAQAGPAGKCKCVAPPSNMVAWYGFDQSGVSQNDLTSYGNTATANNTTSIAGEVAGSLLFDGFTSYAEAPQQSQLNLGMGNFSIDAWVKIANDADYQGVVTIMDKRDVFRGYHMFLYNGRVGVQLADGASFSNYISTQAVPADNRWHLVAVTVARGLPTGGKWYMDGLSLGTFNPTAHPGSLTSTSPLDIGRRTVALHGGAYFKGGIDELEIFNRELSASEISGLMNAGCAGKCKN